MNRTSGSSLEKKKKGEESGGFPWMTVGIVFVCAVIGVFLWKLYDSHRLIAPSTPTTPTTPSTTPSTSSTTPSTTPSTLINDGLPQGRMTIVDQDNLYIVPGWIYDGNVYNAAESAWKSWMQNTQPSSTPASFQGQNFPSWIFTPTGAGGVYEIADARLPQNKLCTQTQGSRIPILVQNPQPGVSACQWEILPASSSQTNGKYYIKSLDNASNVSVFLGGGDVPDGHVYLYGPEAGGIPNPHQHRCVFSLVPAKN